IVPGSILMYGSILSSVTLKPRASSSAPSDAAASPLPSDETTPPLTNINLVLPRSTLPRLPRLNFRRGRPIGPRQIGRRIHLERRRERSHHPDPIAALERAQLLELFDLFEHARLE